MPVPFWRSVARFFRSTARRRTVRSTRRAVRAEVYQQPVEPMEQRRLLSSAVIFADGFEGTGPTLPGWSVRTYSGGSNSPIWGPSTVKAFDGSRSAFSGGPENSAYANDQHTGLVREHVSLAGYASASLSFKYFLNTEAGYDFFSINVIDAAAQTTRTVFRDSGDDRSAGWQAKSIDLGPYAGHTDLDIEFRFDSDHSVNRTAPSGVWVDDVRLTANTTTSTGSIKGTLFEDADGDRTRDAGEAPLAGWVVYLDRNQNRRRDSNEISRTTDSAGRYAFTGLVPGTYYVAAEGRSGFSQTAPAAADVRAAGAFDVSLHFEGASISTSLRKAVEAAAHRWERIIVGDLPDVEDEGRTIDDIRVDVTVADIDGPGGVLADSSPSAVRDPAPGARKNSGLPYRGFVEMDSADLAPLERNGTLLDVVTHEMDHAFGFGTLWEDNGLVKGGGTGDPRFIGPVAVAQYDAIFGTSASSVPIEGDGAPGTRDSHWRESVFGRELMTGYVNRPPNPISRVTVGSLADLGYVVDLSAADAYVPPGGHPPTEPAGVERPVTVAAGKTRGGIDFGFRRTNRPPTVVSLTVVPNPATSGARLTLKASGVSDHDGGVAEVGFYRESNGESGLQFGEDGDALVGTDSDPAGGFSITVSTAGLAPGGYTYYAVAIDDKGAASAGGRSAPSAKDVVQSAARVRGSVFLDADGDGARDAGETALAGARVYLDSNGNDRFDDGEPSALSDDDGAYAIDGLSPGGYTVRCAPPKGYVRTAPAAGKYSVDLSPGESVTLRSFGAAPEAHITGRVFDDADGDGVKDSDEAGVAGWRVFVDANHNGIFDAGEISTATGSSGTYTLAGLLPGTYTVRLAVLSGWRVTAPASGHFDDLLLAAGQTLSGKNFGANHDG